MGLTEFTRCSQTESAKTQPIPPNKHYKGRGYPLFAAGVNSREICRASQPRIFWEDVRSVSCHNFGTISNAQPILSYAPCPVYLSTPVGRLAFSFVPEIHAFWRVYDCSVDTFSAAFSAPLKTLNLTHRVCKKQWLSSLKTGIGSATLSRPHARLNFSFSTLVEIFVEISPRFRDHHGCLANSSRNS
jgi:hypothetical protein